MCIIDDNPSDGRPDDDVTYADTAAIEPRSHPLMVLTESINAECGTIFCSGHKGPSFQVTLENFHMQQVTD